MTTDLHMEAVVMTWVNTIYFLAIAMAQVPMGRLADIYGRKKVFIAGPLLDIQDLFYCQSKRGHHPDQTRSTFAVTSLDEMSEKLLSNIR